MSKEAKLSFELNKLDWRDMYVLFSKEEIAHSRDFLPYNLSILFVIENKSLIHKEDAKTSLSFC
jgi:hypothetical protein